MTTLQNECFAVQLFVDLTLQAVCSHLSQPDLTDVKLLLQLHDAVNVYYNYTGTTPCFSTNQTSVGSLEVKGWDFQVCAVCSFYI